jgi:hypothetical protein
MADTDVPGADWTLDDHLRLAVHTRVLMETGVRLDREQALAFVALIRSTIGSQGLVVVPAEDDPVKLRAELDDWRHNVAVRAFTAPDADLETVLESLDAKARDFAATVAKLSEIESGESVVVPAEDLRHVLDWLQELAPMAPRWNASMTANAVRAARLHAALPVTKED